MFDQECPQRFVSIDHICERVGLGKSTVLLWESEGRFPCAVRLSATKRVWYEPDVHEWMLARRAESLAKQKEAV